MYFVNRSDIENRLNYIDHLLKVFKEQNSFSSPIETIALERISHGIIEAMLDVGNHMIDGFIMRDPGSYHDIIDILIDERVIPQDTETQFKEVIDLRQMIVQNYLEIKHEEIANVLVTNCRVLEQFSNYIRTYLNNELGVTNAFSNES